MATIAVLLIFSCFLIDVDGWIFSDEYTPRLEDGTLRCYQCDSSKSGNPRDVCDLANWKHANVSEKRNMIMQCPRRRSSFCHLVLLGENGKDGTKRGCSGPNLEGGRTAYLGCFTMRDESTGRESRACLCDALLCNQASNPIPTHVLNVVFTVFLIPVLFAA